MTVGLVPGIRIVSSEAQVESMGAMRRRDISCLATMKSPIRHILACVDRTPFTIAPERAHEFDTELNDFSLILLPQRKWRFNCDAPTRQIWVSRGAVEIIWAASVANTVFYKHAVAGKQFDRPGEIDLQADPELSAPLNTLRWALGCQIRGDESDNWPEELVKPVLNPAYASDLHLADEFCLGTCGFMLHHELAHIRAGHTGLVSDDVSLSQEKEADIAAAEWVLDGLAGARDMRFTKRILSIVNGMLFLNIYGFARGTQGGRRHPFNYDRLMMPILRFLGTEAHIAESYAFAVLSLYMQVTGRAAQTGQFETFRDALESLCDQLAAEAGNK